MLKFSHYLFVIALLRPITFIAVGYICLVKLQDLYWQDFQCSLPGFLPYSLTLLHRYSLLEERLISLEERWILSPFLLNGREWIFKFSTFGSRHWLIPCSYDSPNSLIRCHSYSWRARLGFQSCFPLYVQGKDCLWTLLQENGNF